MKDFKDLEITAIEPAFHRLPGVETIEFIYNREKSELVINVNNTEVAIYTEEKAMRVRKQVTDSELFSKTCPAKHECKHVQNLVKKLKTIKTETL